MLSTRRELLSSDLARQVAERHELADSLSRTAADDELWDGAGNLLLAMTSTRNYQSEIGRYEQARDAYERWIAGAEHRPPSLDRAALLTMVAEDLSSSGSRRPRRDAAL